MKKLVLLLGAFALIGCGEKNESGAGAVEAADSSVDSQAAGNQTEESSADTAKPTPAETPVAESPSESPTPPSEDAKPSADSPKPLISDADVERLLKEAVDRESLEERDDLYYQPNESEPFSGWAKTMSDSEYGKGLTQFKDGKPDGLHTQWHGNGQKWLEGTFKDGEPDGPFTQWYGNGQKEMSASGKDGNEDGLATYWYENGQKELEAIYKDGEEVSAKYWNSKGEEVETYQESQK